jgi:hypothetical protein
MEEPREWTAEEIREQFLQQCWIIIGEWLKYPDKTPVERLEGTVFTLLAVLDGCAGSLPGFLVAPYPAPEDREFHQREGTNWYPENFEGEVRGDIAGSLHDHFKRARPTPWPPSN